MASDSSKAIDQIRLAPPLVTIDRRHIGRDRDRQVPRVYSLSNLSVDSLCYESDTPTQSVYGGVSSNASYLAPEPSAPGDAEPESGAPAKKQRSRPELILTVTSLCLAVAVAALDVTIVTTALPTIAASFGSGAGYTWIGSAFILAHTVSTPVWGAVSDVWGRRPVVLASVVVFFAGSLACAAVAGMGAFVAGRAVQGVGAAGMQTMVNIVICDLFSLRDRGLYLALVSLIWAVASALGPVLGGVFASRLE